MNKVYSDINLGILRLNITNRKVLDIGCGTGVLGVELRKNGNYIYGVDISAEELSIAKNRLNFVNQIDIMQDISVLPNDFDVIIFADILEHMSDPLAILKKFINHLKDRGEIIISVPNVACYNMRLALLLGQFNYKDYGLLDNTHLRFFTKKTIRRLIKDAGLQIVKVDVTPFFARPLFRLYKVIFCKESLGGELEEKILSSKSFQIYKKWIFPLEWLLTKAYPTLLAYQFIIVAKKI